MRTLAPAAYNALLAVLTSSLGNVAVIDGQLGPRSEHEYVQLSKVTQAKAWAGMGAGGQSPQQDRIIVTGLVWTSTGAQTGQAVADMRQRAYDLLGMVEDAIAADVTLGQPRIFDTVVDSSDLEQGATTTGGAAASLTFTVTLAAYLSR